MGARNPRELAAHRRSPRAGSLLEHQHRELAPGQPRGGHEPVQPGADDDDVSTNVRHEPQCGVSAWRPHDAATGVGRRAAEIEPLDWRAIVRPAWRRSQEKQLFERELSLKDVAFGEPELALEVERRQHLPVEDAVPDVRREPRNRVDDRIAERVPLDVPG